MKLFVNNKAMLMSEFSRHPKPAQIFWACVICQTGSRNESRRIWGYGGKTDICFIFNELEKY